MPQDDPEGTGAVVTGETGGAGFVSGGADVQPANSTTAISNVNTSRVRITEDFMANQFSG